MCFSLLCLQVVCPCLPAGQLDSAVGESCADWCHLSLLIVSLRHSGPQQLSKSQHPGMSLQQSFWSRMDWGGHKSEAVSCYHFSLTITPKTTEKCLLISGSWTADVQTRLMYKLPTGMLTSFSSLYGPLMETWIQDEAMLKLQDELWHQEAFIYDWLT